MKPKPGNTCGEASDLETLGMEEWELGESSGKSLLGKREDSGQPSGHM